MLKVSHPLLQLHVLKLLKSQVPYCGRKWRQCKQNAKRSGAQNEMIVVFSKYEGYYFDLFELSARFARRMVDGVGGGRCTGCSGM